MHSNRRLVRWGTLALLVTLMSGCCVAPWGGRYYAGGGYGYGGGGHHQGGGYGGDRGGDHGGGWHH
ncbi:MAG: hypothetical protein ABJD97_18830 [Betaproteobacteria bacterium]